MKQVFVILICTCRRRLEINMISDSTQKCQATLNNSLNTINVTGTSTNRELLENRRVEEAMKRNCKTESKETVLRQEPKH